MRAVLEKVESCNALPLHPDDHPRNSWEKQSACDLKPDQGALLPTQLEFVYTSHLFPARCKNFCKVVVSVSHLQLFSYVNSVICSLRTNNKDKLFRLICIVPHHWNGSPFIPVDNFINYPLTTHVTLTGAKLSKRMRASIVILVRNFEKTTTTHGCSLFVWNKGGGGDALSYIHNRHMIPTQGEKPEMFLLAVSIFNSLRSPRRVTYQQYFQQKETFLSCAVQGVVMLGRIQYLQRHLFVCWFCDIFKQNLK